MQDTQDNVASEAANAKIIVHAVDLETQEVVIVWVYSTKY